ncbi:MULTISPECIES: 5-formyltetrahydrofolate cyclo-ligase [Stenotrophomonas]|uniref:5-formyltetrahydrofolate cyclo-ligase n=1 Tax=Stenotrophomonas rhizophila TaxID=216778 RepID=A0A498CU94_9GAMM|nr:5-formyltetrahydrofolate cyclo-ligase [Stenotrophomonas rhizophila]MCS4278494.1 5-formyltetrahydrofolate cyclo-ligase [Stenotrophomonas rhizophila]RLK57142.1 5-formyltetrahydrofolate cyclo-ligase [Stenotrophomonas rhizophila]
MTDPRSALRQQLRQRRRDLPAAVRLAAAEQLADGLLALPFAPTQGHVAGYWAMDGEIALHRWQMQLPAGLTYCLPVLHEKTLRFAPWRPGQALTTNRFGIPEPDLALDDTLAPEQMALVVAPLVGFDAQGRRLGMGGGWYDRSFAFRHQRPAPPWLVGVGFSVQQVDDLPVQPWDVAVDAICTDVSTLVCVPTNGRHLP